MPAIRTLRGDLVADATNALLAALSAVDIPVVAEAGSPRIRLQLDGQDLDVEVVAVSYCTGERARELVARNRRQTSMRTIVADKITSDARSVLTDAGWSWLDRRGRLHLRGRGLRVDVDVPSNGRASKTVHTGEPVSGRGGLTIAYWLCEHPGNSLSPNRHAPELRLAPSTISTTVRGLHAAGLVDDEGNAVLPELFWELADAWRIERMWLIGTPDPNGHEAADPMAPRWKRTGTAAAAAYGAPVVTTEHASTDLYVVGPVEVSIAVRQFGAAEPGLGNASIAVAPVPAVVAGPVAKGTPVIDGWPAAPLLAVALDLAQDRARGREILGGWEAHGAVWR